MQVKLDQAVRKKGYEAFSRIVSSAPVERAVLFAKNEPQFDCEGA